MCGRVISKSPTDALVAKFGITNGGRATCPIRCRSGTTARPGWITP